MAVSSLCAADLPVLGRVAADTAQCDVLSAEGTVSSGKTAKRVDIMTRDRAERTNGSRGSVPPAPARGVTLRKHALYFWVSNTAVGVAVGEDMVPSTSPVFVA
jgi:hypothetical protein